MKNEAKNEKCIFHFLPPPGGNREGTEREQRGNREGTEREQRGNREGTEREQGGNREGTEREQRGDEGEQRGVAQEAPGRPRA